MFKIIDHSEFKKTAWKNGRGITRQIAISPKDAIFPQDDFLWRLSSAELSGDDWFSVFPGYDRILTITQGQGLRLNGEELRPHVPHHFEGETKVFGALIEGPVVDVGLIYRRNQIQAEMKILRTPCFGLRLEPGVQILFCISGQAQIQKDFLTSGNALQIETADVLNLDILSEAIIFQFQIQEKLQ